MSSMPESKLILILATVLNLLHKMEGDAAESSSRTSDSRDVVEI
jgi:hypothetical protein